MSKPNRKPSRINGATADANGEHRDRGGKFKPGNAAAKGRSSKRQKLEAALRDVVSAEDIAKIADQLKRQATNGGSIKAAALLLSYVIGKPKPMDRTATTGLNLGGLNSIRECAQATAKITAAAASGKVQLGEARILAELVEHTRSAHESIEIEERLALLEERLGESGGNRL